MQENKIEGKQPTTDVRVFKKTVRTFRLDSWAIKDWSWEVKNSMRYDTVFGCSSGELEMNQSSAVKQWNDLTRNVQSFGRVKRHYQSNHHTSWIFEAATFH